MSAVRKVMLRSPWAAARRRAPSIISGQRSVAKTRPSAPTSAATLSAGSPAPVAMSQTCWPCAMSAASMSGAFMRAACSAISSARRSQWCPRPAQSARTSSVSRLIVSVSMVTHSPRPGARVKAGTPAF